MDNSKLIHHPLDRFSFTENMGNLDAVGRDAADKLMTMIGDMRFIEDTIWGTVARFFLLIDAVWFPQLCFSAQINSAMLRAYLWRVERGEEGELENVAYAAQTVFPFPKNEGIQAASLNPEFEILPESLCTINPRASTEKVGLEQTIQKPPLERIRALAAEVEQFSAAHKK